MVDRISKKSWNMSQLKSQMRNRKKGVVRALQEYFKILEK